jgi:polyhydroxybutyrate depolymerase
MAGSAAGQGQGGTAATAGGTTAGSSGNASDSGGSKPSAGCVDGAELSEGKNELQVQNATREYVLRKPTASAQGIAWPLVLALHPNDNTTSYWDGTSGDRALRPLLADKAVLVLPQARKAGASGLGDWRGDLPADLAYFDAVLSQVKASLCIDETRIFAMGFSGGGSFSGVLGCERSDIRAFAAGGAVIYFDESACVGKSASWITIGDDEDEQARLDYRDFFRTYAGCSEMSTPVPPSPCVAYTCPDPGRPVHFCSHPGGHLWPNFGTEAAWNFFAQF